MNDPKNFPTDFRLADPTAFARNMAQVFEHAARIASALAEKGDVAQLELETQIVPVEQITKTLGEITKSYMNDPQRLMDAQMQLWSGYSQLWQNASTVAASANVVQSLWSCSCSTD